MRPPAWVVVALHPRILLTGNGADPARVESGGAQREACDLMRTPQTVSALDGCAGGGRKDLMAKLPQPQVSRVRRDEPVPHARPFQRTVTE